jgi:hypothetical protein
MTLPMHAKTNPHANIACLSLMANPPYWKTAVGPWGRNAAMIALIAV